MDESNQDSRFQRLLEKFWMGSFSSPKEDVLKKLQGLVTNLKWAPGDVTDLFEILLRRFESTQTYDRSHYCEWILKILHLIEINKITPKWTLETGKTLLDLIQDRTVTEENLKEHLEEEKDKELDEILDEIRQEPLNQVDEELLEKVKDVVSSVADGQLPPCDGSELSRLKNVLQKICKAVKKTAKYWPRLTQLVSWCLMALSKTGRLIQVGTGEGKSCIVAMFAAFRALEGQKVDIMSSSTVLAQRDLNSWRAFFKELGIKADCNVMKMEQDLKKCYECPVVYGTVEEFAGDWLKQHFHRMEIFGQRKFQCAIVDEADSLMLDKSHHVVYLSTDMPTLQHLNPVLALIWATAGQYSKISSEITVGKKYPFPQVVVQNMNSALVDELSILKIAEETGLLAKGSANQIQKDSNLLSQGMSNVTVCQLAKFFETAEKRFPFCKFVMHYLNRNGKIEELKQRPRGQDGEVKIVQLLLSSGGVCQYMYSDEASVLKAAEEEVKSSICFTPCELKHDKHTCHIPKFLSKLVNSQLKVWVENAFQAQTMKNDDEYVIETHGIVPVDYINTGVVENCMQWSSGLHQFLEMKHGSKMSPMTAITNYKSNVGFLQIYENQIYGMSGTLGQQVDTEALREIYNGIDTCRIPTFRRRKLFEVEGKVTSDEKEWIESICDAVIEQTCPRSFRGKRAALVICQTINHAKALEKALKNKGRDSNLYVNNNMNNDILKRHLEAGEVIIATNLAGRGTDLQVSTSVQKAGGLFVVQTFLPNNTRVEAQAFGRTARQGSPGSAQLIICIKHLSLLVQLKLMTMRMPSLFDLTEDLTSVTKDYFSILLSRYLNNKTQHPSQLTRALCLSLTENSVSEIKVAKEVRDTLAARLISTYLTSVVPNIKKKEALFSLYLGVLNDLANNKPAASDLAALNEFWAMWLITDYKESDCLDSMKTKLAEELRSAQQKLSQRRSPLSNLHHYTVFGNELLRNKNFKGSIEMYTKAVQEDRCWAAIALYNRAFAYLSQQNETQDDACITRALEDLQNASKSVELYHEQTQVTRFYYRQQSKSTDHAPSRIDLQLAARMKVLQYFKSHITMAVRKLDRVSVFGGTVKVDESLIQFMIPPELLLPLVLFGINSLSAMLSRDILKILQLKSHPSFDIFDELGSLDSLGLTYVYSLDTHFSVGSSFTKVHRFLRRAFI